MYDRHLITFKDKAEYYNKIYPTLHPMYDPNTRIFNQSAKDNDFIFKDGELIYSKNKDLDLTNANQIYPSFNDVQKPQNVHEKISYYLNNNIVPVNLFILFFRDFQLKIMIILKKRKFIVLKKSKILNLI